MPNDEHLIGQTYGCDALAESMKPTIFLIHDRHIHVPSNETITYQEITDFITGDYLDKTATTLHVSPRISILKYVGRFIWSQLMMLAKQMIG